MLCEFCREFNYDFLVSEEGYKHHASWDNLCVSAKRGCNVCSLVSKEPKPFAWTPPDNPHLVCFLNEKLAKIGWCESHEGEFYPRVELGICTSKDDPLARLIIARPLHDSVLSKSSIDMMKNWLGSCDRHDENHKQCPAILDQQLPTRVIDVGTRTVAPRLVITKGRIGRWAALSHCWGDSLPFKTEVSSLEARCAGMPLEDIPATFRDAILATRALGLKLIWIDALCIIQDSPRGQDWELESSRMDHVYKHATVTIAAEGSSNSSIGIDKSTKIGRQIQAKASCASIFNGCKGFVHFRHYIDIYSMDRGVLSGRGWTLQEEMLSPRILRFAPKQILWRCPSQTYREWFPNGGPKRHVEISKSISQVKADFPRIRSRRSRPVTISTANLMKDWYDKVLNNYSSRQLSYQKDRLIAIHGIVEDLKEYLGPYIAGIWLNDIHVGLSWSSFAGARKNTKFAPSWSWASIDSCHMGAEPGKLYNHELEDSEPLSTVMNNDDMGDSLGIVGRMNLKLRGQCQRICTCRVPVPFFDERPINSENIYLADVMYPDDSDQSKFKLSLVGRQACLQGRGKTHNLLVYIQHAEVMTGDSHVIIALILQEVAHERHTYRRVGRAFIPVTSDSSRSWPTWIVNII